MYRSVSQNAYCFIIEYDSDPIGECWLQKMNLKRIINKFPDCDCRRIDIMIGEKEFCYDLIFKKEKYLKFKEQAILGN